MQLARLTGLVLLSTALLGFGRAPFPSAPLEPDTDPWVAQGSPSEVPVDTLRPTVEAGESLILSLPSQLASAPVTQYSLIRGPSLSGVADQSFTWMTHSVEPDTYDALLQATRSQAPPDTLLLRIEVQK